MLQSVQFGALKRLPALASARAAASDPSGTA